jgi:hypothetical protein
MNNLVDIMEQLSRLTNLTSLTVDNFHSDGRGWEQLALMTNLKVVEGLIGTPNYVWKQLTRLQSLESKYDKKKLTDFLDVVPYLTNLESLNIRTPNILNAPFSMITAAHTRLTYLEIEADSITEWNKGVENLRSIKSFSIAAYGPEKGVMQPLSLRSMTDLESLSSCFPVTDLNSTRLKHLYGPYTPTERQYFTKMESLQHFSVEDEEDMAYLSIFSRLESLSVSSSSSDNYTQNNSFLRNIVSTQLVYLCLHKLTDMIDFRYLTQLRSIENMFLFNTLCDYNVLALKNLTQLSHQEYGYDGDYENDTSFLKAIEQLDKLRILRHVSGRTKDVTVDLSNLPNLERLTLSVDAAKFIGIYNLTNLTSLEIQANESFVELPYLANLTNLRALVCQTDSDVFQYVTALKMLNELSVDHFHNEEELLLLTSLTRLTTLVAENNLVQEVKGIYMTRLTMLQTIRWRETTPEIVEDIKTMPNLVSFITW